LVTEALESKERKERNPIIWYYIKCPSLLVPPAATAGRRFEKKGRRRTLCA
jgi:hypothetical protein